MYVPKLLVDKRKKANLVVKFLLRVIAKAIDFALFETPSFTQNAAASEYPVRSKGPPNSTDKPGVIYEDAESRTEDRV